MSTLELMRMARRGEADGHDRAWFAQYAKTPRLLTIMHDAADEERRGNEATEIAEEAIDL